MSSATSSKCSPVVGSSKIRSAPAVVGVALTLDEMANEFETLRLAAGERVEGLTQTQVTQPDLGQDAQGGERHTEHVRHAFQAVAAFQKSDATPPRSFRGPRGCFCRGNEPSGRAAGNVFPRIPSSAHRGRSKIASRSFSKPMPPQRSQRPSPVLNENDEAERPVERALVRRRWRKVRAPHHKRRDTPPGWNAVFLASGA